jgi:hypothetical protein
MLRYRVKEKAMIMLLPASTPQVILMKGRAPTPSFHPLNSGNAMGYATKQRYRKP